MDQKYLLAIEIGSSKIKGAVGTLDPDGILTLEAVEEERLVDSVRHGIIINVDNVTNRIRLILKKLENRVSPHKAVEVYIGVGGRSFMASTRTVEQQLSDDILITSEHIEQLRNEAKATDMLDREVISVTEKEYQVDGVQNSFPVGTYGRNIRATFSLISCRDKIIRNIKRAITERLNLKIAGIFVRQLAEGDLVVTNDERFKGCMLVDMGAETTTVSIYRIGVLWYMATLPMGSRNITRDIVQICGTEERAERIKTAGSNALLNHHDHMQSIDSSDYTEVNQYVNARATEIAANITEQMKYAEVNSTDLPGGIILIGGGAKQKGFKEVLENLSKMKVRAGTPNSMVRMADSRLSAYDCIDVVSTLWSASKLDNVADCMVAPEPAIVVQPDVTNHVDTDAEAEAAAIAAQQEAEEKRKKDEEEARTAAINHITHADDDDNDIDEVKAPGFGSKFRDRWQKLIDKTAKILDENPYDDEE